jgi:outer membrane lipoprotein carrier protein
VIDGKHVWIYTPSTVPGQVIRMRVPSGGPVYGYNLLAWLLDRPAERYRASYLRSERIAGRNTDVIELVPAVPDLPFTRAIVWLDREDALPRKLEIKEQSGATRTLSLSRIRANEAVPKQVFTFKVPAKARVVDQ